MELYVLSKQNLKILSICKVAKYEINLDEETNAKSTFTLMKTNGLVKDNFMVLNGLYRQFLFVISDVQVEKGSDEVAVTALDISNIFDRKVIEKNTETMKTKSIEEFIANTMYENFVNSEDTVLNLGYVDISWHTTTQAVVDTNVENGLYNFHTFLINCRQYKNIYTEFKFENNRLKIDISYKEEIKKLIDTTLPEVIDYNKVYEDDVTAKVTVLIREDGSEYNLYLRTDRTTTTDKNDKNRAKGKIEVISVDTADKAPEEALNVIKGNSYNHLVEFKIAKTSKVMDITELHVGRPIRIKTDDDIYDSYISAITLTDENFIYFKSGNIRTTLIDKLKKNENNTGNKLDKTGGTIQGSLNIEGDITQNGKEIALLKDCRTVKYFSGLNDSALDDIPTLLGEDYQSDKPYSIFFNPATVDSLYGGCCFLVEGFYRDEGYGSQTAYSYDGENCIKKRSCWAGTWTEWINVNKKEVASLTLSTRTYKEGVPAWTRILVPTDTLNCSSNNSIFTYKNNGIRVNKSIKALISFNLSMITYATNIPEVDTFVQGSTLGEIIRTFSNTTEEDQLFSTAGTSKVINIPAGELINLYLMFSDPRDISILEADSTYFTIQEV